MPTAEVLSQGDEIVTGQTVDSNAAWLAERLTDLGFTLVRHVGVGDRMPDLVGAFRTIDERADLCVCTGGLGPTDDDLTTAAVAEAFGCPVRLDEEALAQLRARYDRFGRKMAPVNERQAWLPEGCVRLDNDWGTAPGFAVRGSRALFACLPGVPREMRKMFDARVLPLLHEHFSLQPDQLVTLRCVGVGESDLQQALEGWEPANVTVGFRTKLPENHLKLRFSTSAEADHVMAVVEQALDRVGQWVFSVEGAPRPIHGWNTEGGDLATVVGRRLVARQHTLALAESCTGGRISAACTSMPGASAWFLEGLVTYSNAAKVRLLGVPEAVLAEHGAVSEAVARAMAAGVRERSGATWGVSVTGIAGPSGGSEHKPVGTVHLGLVGPSTEAHLALRLPGDRHRVQELSVAAALNLLRQHLA